MTTEQETILNETITELRLLVKEIENKPLTTKDHYGDYMAVISHYPATERKTVAILLYKAGGNLEGIKWALRLLTSSI